MKIIVLGVLSILMRGTIASSNESQPASVEAGPLNALQRIAYDLDQISVEKNNHHKNMKDGIVQRFQAILQSDKERHEILRASLQKIIDDSSDLTSFGKNPIEIINHISKKIEYFRENDKQNIKILENETNAQVDALNKKRSDQETELKAMVLKLFTMFSPLKGCSELMKFGFNTSGIYQIKPEGMDLSFPAYCEVDTDGRGWTVIQRRGDFNDEVVNFNRSWNEYKNGFGNLNGEFWFGNDKIFFLTKKKDTMIKVSVRPYDSDTIRVRTYKDFYLEPEQQSYMLKVYTPGSGNNDPFEDLSYGEFKTYDHNPICYKGAGWWYRYRCPATAHLNGPRGNVKNRHGVTFDGYEPVAFSTMKINV